MDLLVLGGTAWLGHAVASAALDAGHRVTCLARGDDVPAGADLVRADRDHDDALAGVTDRSWDAVVDVARQPGHVRRAVRDLEPVADRYVFVSSVSAYASQAELGADERAALLPPLAADEYAGADEYGAAKVAGEEAVVAGFGPDRATIVRPGLIGGPGDPTGRSSWWPARFARSAVGDSGDVVVAAAADGPDEVLVPLAPDLPTSMVDVRDLAAWIVRLATRGPGGAFDAVGTSRPFPELIDAARRVAGHDGPVVSAPPEWLLTQGVAQWAGPRSLPLWIAEREAWGMNARSGAAARAAGLRLRPLDETLRDALEAERRRPDAEPHGSGLTPAEEAELLAAVPRA